ncbi:MAG: amidohydrolase family protein [Cyclobacteriaceae bacterium]|nr:amidohydrolase family protein [Cyclobacteriaceae bacterium]
MKKLVGILMMAATVAAAQSPVDSRQQAVVFRSVNVIPMDAERVLENQDVVARDGKILAMGPSGKVAYEKSAFVVEARGKYLIPGLAEMHAHIPPNDNVAAQKEVLLLFALNGVTTVRGMLGHPTHLTLRDQVNRGEVLGPHIYTSGPSFNGLSVKTPEYGEKMVRDQKQLGYDFLKLHPGLTLANFNAIVKTANEVGITYGGHVSSAVGVWRAIDANYSTIDHLDGFIEGMVPGIEAMTDQEIGFFGLFVGKKADLSQLPRLVEGLREHRVWVVPTQALAERWIAADKSPEELRAAPEMKYMDPKTLDAWTENKKRQMAVPGYNAEEVGKYIELRRRIIKACNDGGVGLLLGSDAPQVFNVPGYSVHHELRYLVQAGLTPYQALKTGTVNVAAFYNQSATSGTVAEGKVSNLVLLNGNPLKDIASTQSIEGVMLGSQWLQRAYLDAELKRLEKGK